MGEKILFIVNPVSGKVSLKSKLWQVVDMLCAAGFIPTIRFTQKRGDASDFAKNCPKDFGRVICAGGDGTLNEVINGLMQNPFEHILGYLPVGTTNDLANSLGIPRDIKAAVENIIDGHSVTIDIGSFNDKKFNYIASFGAFTEASYSAPQEVKNTIGHAAYLIEGLKSLGSISPYEVMFSFDGNEIKGKYIFASISNTTSVGGLLKFSENLVTMNDGLFEVLLVKEPANLNQLQKIISELLTQKFSGDLVSLYHTSSITVETRDFIDWTLDGEYQRGSSKTVIKNIPRAVRIIVPDIKK